MQIRPGPQMSMHLTICSENLHMPQVRVKLKVRSKFHDLCFLFNSIYKSNNENVMVSSYEMPFTLACPHRWFHNQGVDISLLLPIWNLKITETTKASYRFIKRKKIDQNNGKSF